MLSSGISLIFLFYYKSSINISLAIRGPGGTIFMIRDILSGDTLIAAGGFNNLFAPKGFKYGVYQYPFI